MARKKTPPEYGLSPYCILLSALSASPCNISNYHTQGCVVLGAPSGMVNIQVPLSLLASETGIPVSVGSQTIEKKACNPIPDKHPAVVLRKLTRSSPIGPAEHDDGGSL